MDPSAAPPGGLPWVVAIPAFGAMATAMGVLWRSKVAAGRLAVRIAKEKDAVIQAGVDAREKLRLEKDAQLEKCERRADGLEREFREHLDRSIGILAKARAGTPDRCYSIKPAGESLEAKKRDFKNLSEVVSPEEIRRAREAMDQTQDP